MILDLTVDKAGHKLQFNYLKQLKI